jgi:hypothetical protein
MGVLVRLIGRVGLGLARVAFLLCLVASLAWASAAQAEPAWSGPVEVGHIVSGGGPPSPAMNAVGGAVVAWGSSAFGTSSQAAFGTGGVWEAPTSLGAEGYAVQVGLDEHGDATAVWQSPENNTSVHHASVRAATKRAGSDAWQAPVDLSAALGGEQQIAVDPQGTAIAVWKEETESNYVRTNVIEAAVMSPSGVWGQPLQLSLGEHEAVPAVALNEQGEAIVLWRNYEGQGATSVYAVSSAGAVSGGSWQHPVRISATGEEEILGIVVSLDPHGDAVAAWEGLASGGRVVMGTTRAGNSGAWRPPHQLSNPNVSGANPSVALDHSGDAVAVWEQRAAEEVSVQAVSGSTASGGWGEPIKLATTDHEPEPVCPPNLEAEACSVRPRAEPQVGMSAQGEAVAAWVDSPSGTYMGIVQAAVRPAVAAPWQEPLDLSAQDANNARLAVSANGSAVAAWITEGPKPTVEADTLSSPAAKAPAIDSESVSHVTSTDATLEAQINTEGLETSYEFHLATPPCPSGCEHLQFGFPLPSGKLLGSSVTQSVSLDLNSAGVTLTPGQRYEYWVTATNAAGTASALSEEKTFAASEDGVQPLNITTPPSTTGPALSSGQGTVTSAPTGGSTPAVGAASKPAHGKPSTKHGKRRKHQHHGKGHNKNKKH